MLHSLNYSHLYKQNEDMKYNMKAEFLNLTFSQESIVSISFLTEYLEMEGSYEKVINIYCDMEKLKKFYEHFTNVDMVRTLSY